jgi:hypothetical protein
LGESCGSGIPREKVEDSYEGKARLVICVGGFAIKGRSNGKDLALEPRCGEVRRVERINNRGRGSGMGIGDGDRGWGSGMYEGTESRGEV